MSTDHQSARVALGARLRMLRAEAGLDGQGIAERLGWQRSKVSRLETGKQTPTSEDLRQWAQAVGRPDVADELAGRLTGLETRYRSMRRQLAGGHLARQEVGVAGDRSHHVAACGGGGAVSRPVAERRLRPARVHREQRVPADLRRGP
ncbi:helix-turn-helix transcriptional regulator [Streptomyces sp. NPDC093509]|uniref:helix-turn-helix domain-containing protein n=1 Tax=Streptomyces sp. NPDC093509 TaxID=3154982 RepID=UPI00344F9E0F